MKDREYWIKWSKAAGIRAVKTIAETAISLIVSLDWVNIAGVCATAGVISLLMSLKGLPEVNVPEYRDSEGE